MGFFGSENCRNLDILSIVKDCYTGSEVPNETVENVLGMIQYTRRKIDANVIDKIDDMFQILVQGAKRNGADAVINVKMTTGSYQAQGSGWVVSFITIYGEAVTLK